MLIWLLDHDYIEAAMVSGVEDDDAWKAKPALVHNRDEVIATAGSRYTYCANPLALRQAKEEGLSRLALVGMGCQTSSPPTMWDRKAGKVSKPFVFNIGLLCSKTFDDAIFTELFEAKYGLPKSEMVKMNIKGVFQIWMRDGSYHEIDLKECHAWTRQGCKRCPDFAAEHADISLGGIGKDNDWTLTIVRTDLGSRGRRPDDRRRHDPRQAGPGRRGGDELLRTLSIVSRRRWPAEADPAPLDRCAAAEEEDRRRSGELISPRWSPPASSTRSALVAAVASVESAALVSDGAVDPDGSDVPVVSLAAAPPSVVHSSKSSMNSRIPSAGVGGRVALPGRIPGLVLVGDLVELVVGVALEPLQHALLLLLRELQRLDRRR